MKSRSTIFAAALLICGSLAASAAPPNARHGRPIAIKPVEERIPGPAKPKIPGKDGPAHVGEAVTISAETGPLKLTVDRLELQGDRFRIGDTDSEIPSGTEKLLIIHYTLVNPNSTEVSISGKTVRFTALDAERKPHADIADAITEGDTDIFDGPVKAGEKVSLVKVVHVPSRGPIAALLATPGPAGTTEMHVDVSGHVEKLAAPYVDPQDANGFTALPTVAAKIGTTYQVGDCDLTMTDADYSTDPLLNFTGEAAPDSEHLYAVFTFEVTCQKQSGVSFGFDDFNPSLNTIDGLQIDPANAPLLNGKLNLAFESDLQYNDDRHFRVYFIISKHDGMVSLTISAGNGARKFIYDVSDIPKPAE